MRTKCRDCGAKLGKTNRSGWCKTCRNRHYMAEWRARVKAEKEAEAEAAFWDASPSIRDAVPHRVRPAGKGVPCIMRSPETGLYIDLTTGRVTERWESFFPRYEKKLAAEK